MFWARRCGIAGNLTNIDGRLIHDHWFELRAAFGRRFLCASCICHFGFLSEVAALTFDVR
jgi:hypothetical protein